VAASDVNISRAGGNDNETAISHDPSNPARLFLVSNTAGGGIGSSGALMAAYSTDAGQTWNYTDPGDMRIGDTDDMVLPSACCDASAVFDRFGNLFLAYVDTSGKNVEIARSSDGGQTFTLLQTFNDAGGVDQPNLAVGPGSTPGSGSVWVTFQDGSNNMVAAGASVTGLGVVGAFSALETAPGSSGGDFDDIAVGPAGQVLIAYQTGGGESGGMISVNVDADGLGAGGFGAAVPATNTNVGTADDIPADVPTDTGHEIDAEASLAYGPDGRAYLVYTDENPDESDNTDILERFSDDNGANWSSPVKVNDDATTRSQFLPDVAVDPGTGFVGVSWFDARNDDGMGGAGDTDGMPNTDVQFFATVSTNRGAGFLANVQVSKGTTNSVAAGASIGLGDYTSLTFVGGVLNPAWPDNSNSTGDNPDGALSRLDDYTSAVTVTPSGEVVNVTGDEQFANQDDTIRIALDASGTFIEFFVNGTLEYTAPRAAVTQINVNGLGGDDRLVVDSSNGVIDVDNGIRYDGGTGVDRLDLRQTGGPSQTSNTLEVGATAGNGRSSIIGPGGSQRVDFDNVEPVTDTVPAAAFTLSGVPALASLLDASNSINYTASQIISSGGRITVDNFEPVEFSGKTTLNIDAGAGTDTINLHNASTPTGLTQINVDGGDPTDGDTVIANGTTSTDAINFAPTAADAADVTGAGPVATHQSAVEALTINGLGGNDTLTVTTPAGQDVVTVDPGPVADTGTITLRRGISSGGSQLLGVRFTNLGTTNSNSGLNFADAGGMRDDQLTINGRDLANGSDLFLVSLTGIVDLKTPAAGGNTIRILVPVQTPGVGALRLNGLPATTSSTSPATSRSPRASPRASSSTAATRAPARTRSTSPAAGRPSPWSWRRTASPKPASAWST
jgi:hypothetical protein